MVLGVDSFVFLVAVLVIGGFCAGVALAVKTAGWPPPWWSQRDEQAPTGGKRGLFEPVPPTKPRFWILAALWAIPVFAVLFGIPALIGGDLGYWLARLAFLGLVVVVVIFTARSRTRRSRDSI
jgi:hypothetical protein